MEAIHHRPAVSIIIPFAAKMRLKNELAHSLKMASDKVELELMENYSDQMGKLVMNKL